MSAIGPLSGLLKRMEREMDWPAARPPGMAMKPGTCVEVGLASEILTGRFLNPI